MAPTSISFHSKVSVARHVWYKVSGAILGLVIEFLEFTFVCSIDLVKVNALGLSNKGHVAKLSVNGSEIFSKHPKKNYLD